MFVGNQQVNIYLKKKKKKLLEMLQAHNMQRLNCDAALLKHTAEKWCNKFLALLTRSVCIKITGAKINHGAILTISQSTPFEAMDAMQVMH